MIKEIVLYNYFNRVEIVLIIKFGLMIYFYVSIDYLIEEFVSSLQLEFLFIVSIIFRIGDKLLGKEFFDDYLICVFCGVFLIFGERLYSVDFYDSIRFFLFISDCCSDCNGRCLSLLG